MRPRSGRAWPRTTPKPSGGPQSAAGSWPGGISSQRPFRTRQGRSGKKRTLPGGSEARFPGRPCAGVSGASASSTLRGWRLPAVRTAGSRQPRKVLEALAPLTPAQGLPGNLASEPPGSVRFFPLRPWRVRKGRWEEMPPGQLPAADCGPPLGFGVVRGHARPERGRIGWLTYGEAPTRTIEADLNVLGLTTGGYDPELDQLILDEIL